MGQTTINKDGQTVVLPFEQVTGQQLKDYAGIAPDRHVTVAEGGQTRLVGDQERVTLAPGTFVSDAPRFRYGANAAVGRRLAAEVAYISQMYRQRAQHAFDPNIQRWYVHLPAFALPPGWLHASTPILVTVTDQYPAASPDGFFLSNALRHQDGSTPSHYFETSSTLNPLSSQGWAWFCIHPEGWRSSYDLRDGDSVAKYLTLIHLTMSQSVSGRAGHR